MFNFIIPVTNFKVDKNVYYHDKRDNWPKTNGQMAKIKLTYEQNWRKRNDYFHTLQNYIQLL